MLRYYGPIATATLVLAVTLAFLDREFTFGPWEFLGVFAMGFFLVMGLHVWLEDNGWLDRR
jgi:hypothetical protein